MILPPDTAAHIGTMLSIAHVSKDAISDVMKRLFGKTLDRAGDSIADHFFGKKVERATDLAIGSVQMLVEANIEPRPVPPEVWYPILDHGSWAEDPDFQKKWQALLANAASPGEVGKVLPAFADILRVLTPMHARILDWMYSQEVKSDVPTWFSTWPDFERKAIEETFNLSPADYALLINDMERLRLIEPHRQITSTEGNMDGEELLQWVMIQLNDREKYKTVSFTAMGLRFMQACTPPKSPA